MKNTVHLALAAALLTPSGAALAQGDPDASAESPRPDESPADLAPEDPETPPSDDATEGTPAEDDPAASPPNERDSEEIGEAPGPPPVSPPPSSSAPPQSAAPPSIVPHLRPAPESAISARDARSATPPTERTSASSPPSSSTPPPSSSPPPSSEPAEEGAGGGLYLDGNLAGTYGLRSTHEWNHTCPEVVVEADPTSNWNPTCSATTPLGIAMEGRIGVRIGIVGIEGFGLGAVDFSSGELGGEKPEVELPGFASSMQIGRVGGGFGGGVRFMSNGFLRVSTGLGGGVIFRHVFSNVSSLDGSSTGYTAPLLKADLSLTLAKFLNLGLLGWVEFSPEVKVTPNLAAAGAFSGVDPNDPNIPPETRAMLEAFENALGDVTVFDGPQFFLGPYLGLHFGK